MCLNSQPYQVSIFVNSLPQVHVYAFFLTEITYMYCGIIIVQGGLMFVDFVGYPYSQIYVPRNF